MTRSVLSVGPHDTVEAATATLVETGVSGLPVLDAEGRLVGVVSQTDLLRPPASASVEEVMMPVTFTLRETDSLARAAALMAAEQIHRIPIVDADGRVLGIVTTLDVVRWLTQP
jgi:CBS domain-containing protein